MKKRFNTRSVETESEWDTGRTEVIEVLDDGKENFIGSDGGEPEDQTLDRNWSWVVEALNKAYEDGYNKAIVKVEEFEDGLSGKERPDLIRKSRLVAKLKNND